MKKLYKLFFILLLLLCSAHNGVFAINIDDYSFENPIQRPKEQPQAKEEMNTGEIYVKEIEVA